MKNAIRFFLFAFIFMYSTNAYSQFGVRGKYNVNSFSGFDNYIDSKVPGNNDKLFPSSIGLGLDYWFRLKNYRIEFLPEFHMGLKSESQITESTSSNLVYYGFNFNTQVYLFDLEGDCDCPTFSKQGPSLKKGFFFNVSPGVLFMNKELSTETSDPPFKSNHINFKIGVGVGYDIGISDLFTITPMVNYNIVPGVNFNELSNISNSTPTPDPEVIDSGFRQLQFQLRLGFRPDYVKSYGRRR